MARPGGFDLAAFWQEWTQPYERSVYTASATVRMTARALESMPFVFPPEMARVAHQSAGEPDSSGWLTTTVPIESIRHGHTELLKLGADAEVLGRPSCATCWPGQRGGWRRHVRTGSRGRMLT